jgi:hypothetical protein
MCCIILILIILIILIICVVWHTSEGWGQVEGCLMQASAGMAAQGAREGGCGG